MTTLVILGKYIQTPDENKRYTFDYSSWLDTGETIDSATSEISNVTTPPLAVTDLITTATVASFFISGGKHLESYNVIITVTTSAGQVKQDAITVRIRDYTP